MKTKRFFATILAAMLLLGALAPGMMSVSAEEPFTTEPMIASGVNHALALKYDGTVWGWGYNGFGEVDYRTAPNLHYTPVQIQDLSNVVAISAGRSNLALKNDGTVWAWGLTYWVDDEWDKAVNADYFPPTQVQNLSDVIAIQAGAAMAGMIGSLALKSDGTVWCWGKQTQSFDAEGVHHSVSPLAQVPGLSNIKAISSNASDHALALKKDGTVLAWGTNFFGQLGDGTCEDRSIPVQVPGLSDVVAIVAGVAYSLALKNDGTVWAWGHNLYGELGDGTYNDRYVPVQVLNGAASIAAGASSHKSFVLKNDSTVWAWGNNVKRELGYDALTSNDGNWPSHCSPLEVQNLNDVRAIDGGYCFSYVLKNDGFVLGWGWNDYGQLGDGSTTDHLTPAPVLGPNGVGQLNLLPPAEYEFRFHFGNGTEPKLWTSWTNKAFYLSAVQEFTPFTRVGCVLLGWSETPGAAQPDYKADDVLYVNRNADFYAVWAFSKDVNTGENVSVSPADAFGPGTEMRVSVTGMETIVGEPSDQPKLVVVYDINFTGYGENDYPLATPVTVRLSIPQAFLNDGGKVSDLIVMHKGDTISNARAVQIEGKWYMEFETDHFSEYAIAWVPQGSNYTGATGNIGNTGDTDDTGNTGDAGSTDNTGDTDDIGNTEDADDTGNASAADDYVYQSWWARMPGWLQWILHWLCFGWIWMK